MDWITLCLIVGYFLAAYSVVANDGLQIWGPFLNATNPQKWYWQFVFMSIVLWIVALGGWYYNSGDLAWGRLEIIPTAENATIFHAVFFVAAPALLVFLTWKKIPVSTTFLVLSVFSAANSSAIEKMITKSVMGYIIAAGFAYIIWHAMRYVFDEFQPIPKDSRKFWTVAQWVSTGFLWSTWLMHDLANIAVFLPRNPSLSLSIGALSVMTLFLGIIVYKRGGGIQEIVHTKTGMRCIRRTTLVNIFYAFVLIFFKELNNVPMSTTWVFMGLIAGRELAVRQTHPNEVDTTMVFPMVIKDLFKTALGLGLSVMLALIAGFVLRHENEIMKAIQSLV